MPDTTGVEDILLSAILPNNSKNMGIAALALTEDHFTDPTNKTIFKLLVRYYNQTDLAVMPLSYLSKIMEMNTTLSESLKVALETKFADLCGTDSKSFRPALEELKEFYNQKLTETILADAYNIIREPKKVNGEELKGSIDARAYAIDRLHEIDKNENAEQAPEGNVFGEASSFLREYEAAKTAPESRGLALGIPELDNTDLTGINRGELVTIAAYTSTGKTQFATHLAWNTSVREGKNVFLVTTETLRSQVHRRIISRHTRESKFGLPDGVNARHILNPRLATQEEDEVVKAAIQDLKDGYDNGEYGTLNIVQLPRGANLHYVEARLKEFGKEVGGDLCIIDSLNLIDSTLSKQRGEREGFNSLIRHAKLMAVGFNNGEGIPVVTPWQISREGKAMSEINEYFSLNHLADTAEIERSSDIIMALLRSLDSDGTPDPDEIRIQHLKMRDSATPPIKAVGIDFRTSYFGHRTISTHSFASTDGDNMDAILDSL